jgi:hypothetical protein
VGKGDADMVEQRLSGAGPRVDAREMKGKPTAATGVWTGCPSGRLFLGKHFNLPHDYDYSSVF